MEALKSVWVRRGAPLLVLSGMGASAMAAVPAEFTDAVADAVTDAGGMALALLGVAAAVVTAMIALKFIKRIRGAA